MDARVVVRGYPPHIRIGCKLHCGVTRSTCTRHNFLVGYAAARICPRWSWCTSELWYRVANLPYQGGAEEEVKPCFVNLLVILSRWSHRRRGSRLRQTSILTGMHACELATAPWPHAACCEPNSCSSIELYSQINILLIGIELHKFSYPNLQRVIQHQHWLNQDLAPTLKLQGAICRPGEIDGRA
jgi:hypothetical protein